VQTGRGLESVSLKKHKGWWQLGRGQIIKDKNVTLEHEIAIEMLYTQQHDNLSDSMWQLKNNY
jgi:hypothetical protein